MRYSVAFVLAVLAPALASCAEDEATRRRDAVGAAGSGPEPVGVAGLGGSPATGGAPGMAGGSAGASGSAGSAGSAGCGPDSCRGDECSIDSECAGEERCRHGYCEALPCGVHAFTYDAGTSSPTSVHVAGSFNGWQVNDATKLEYVAASGLWKGVFDLGEGEHEYKLVLDETEWVLDPMTPSSGENSLVRVSCPATCRGGSDDFDWRDHVMYSLLIDRFADGDGSGSAPSDGGTADSPRFGWGGGDLQGLLERLPYLQDLGVSALWLSSPALNSDRGYHGYYPAPADIDYAAPSSPSPTPQVDPRFGTAAALESVVAQAHGAETTTGHGMQVLLDYVMKHVHDSSGLARAHQDWFHITGGVKLCNNGTETTSDDLWQDPYWSTRCSFGSALWPFDYDKPAALEWSMNDALWWAERFNLDGYRLDAIRHVAEGWSMSLRQELAARLGNHGEDFYLVGETYDFGSDALRPLVDPRRQLTGQLDFPLRSRVLDAMVLRSLPLEDFASFIEQNDSFYGVEAVMGTFLGNHDLPRVIHVASGEIGSSTEGSHSGNNQPGQFSQPAAAAAYEKLALAYAVLMTSPGLPVIYYGDEIGLSGGGDPENRRMMPWDDSQLIEPQIWLRNAVKTLAKLRAEYKVLGRGERVTEHVGDDVWVYRKLACADWPSVLVAFNRGDQAAVVPLPAGEHQNLITGALASGTLELGARSFTLLEAGE